MAHGDDSGNGNPSDETLGSLPSPGALEGKLVGRYRLLSWLGVGASGAVYRAHDPTIGRLVALKLIRAPGPPATKADPVADEAFREAKAAGAFLHPNIVALHDAGRDGEFYYLAMELIEGRSLADELKESGRLAVEQVIDIGVSIARALHVAHEHHIVHCDIKPSNLLLSSEGVVKIADFGVARLLEPGSTAVTSESLGTPSYVSPEQLKEVPADARSDVFSLGTVLYECVTGLHPFRRESIAGTLNAVLTVVPTPACRLDDRIPARLSDAIDRAMRKDPTARFASAADFADELAAISIASAHGPEDPTRRWVLLWIPAGLAALSALLWSSWQLAPAPARRDSEAGMPLADVPEVQPLAQEEHRVTTFGVMPFEHESQASELGWIGEALRDGFNTELSEVQSAKVYSKEFLAFYMTKKQMSRIEALTALGVEKMISGSFAAFGDELRITTNVMDVSSGVIDVSLDAIGPADTFFGLRTQIVLSAIERMQLPISEAERRTIESRRHPSVESFKRFLDAERGSTASARAPVLDPISKVTLLGTLARLIGWFADPALAQDPDPEEAIRDLLERYRKAMEDADLDAMATVYLGYDEEARRAQKAYFDNTKGLQITIKDVEIAVVGEEGVASFTRADQFSDAESGEEMDMVVRLTKTLRRTPEGWRMELGS